MSGFPRKLSVGVLVLILLAGTYLNSGSGEAAGRHGSVYSRSDHGRSTAFQLLARLGFEVQVWDQAPGELPPGAAMLLLASAPEAPEHYRTLEELGDQGSELPGPGALLDPAHYRSFVERGGTLVLPAYQEHWPFLAKYFDLDLGLDSLPLEEDSDESSFLEDVVDALETDLQSGAFPEIEDEPAGGRSKLDYYLVGLWADRSVGSQESVALTYAHSEPIPPRDRLQVVASGPQGQRVVSVLELGKGQLVLLESDQIFDNAWIDEEDNVLLAVRLAERFAGNGKILFDEYALGGWIPESPLELALGARARPLSLHLAALLALLIWSAAWVRWFPRDPQPLGAVSAEVRARGLAGMLANQGRWTLLGRMLRLGLLRKLLRRGGMGRQLLERDEESLLDAEWQREHLSGLLGSHGQHTLEQGLGLLHGAEVASREELNDLARGLQELERATLERKIARSDGTGRTPDGSHGR